jgi:bacterioferritin-associated ferredoxin
MIVCMCRNVSDRTVERAIEGGARSVTAVAGATGAGTSCGCCHGTIEVMLARRAACGGGGCEACPRRAAAAAVDTP